MLYIKASNRHTIGDLVKKTVIRKHRVKYLIRCFKIPHELIDAEEVTRDVIIDSYG